MKISLYRITVLFLCFLTGASLHAQVITGRVLDESGGQPVMFAHIYFSDTFVGTTSDTSGYFSLDVSGRSTMPITVSCVGYYSRNLSNYSAHSFVSVE